MVMDDSDTVSAFASRLIALVGEIRSLGEKLPDSAVVNRLFAVVPDRFSQIIGTIEQWGDMKKMSVIEAVSRLRTFEESESGRRQDRSGDDGEKLMLISRSQLEALILKEKKKGEGSSSGSKKALLAGIDVDDEPALLMAAACEVAPVVERATDVVGPEDMEAKELPLPSADEAEFEDVKAEAARLRGELAMANEKLRALSDENRAGMEDAAEVNGEDEYAVLLLAANPKRS